MVKLFIHSFGYRFHYRFKPGFGIFAFLDKAAELGFSGVNVSAFPPNFYTLNGAEPGHVRAIRNRVEANKLLIDIECNGTAPAHLTSMLDLAGRLGAGYLRTYVKPDVAETRQRIDDAVRDLSAIGPVAERAGIPLLLENHEDFTGPEMAEILRRVGHPFIAALYDYGNSMVFMEEPLTTLEHMRPWIRSAHMKDHVTIPVGAAGNSEPIWLGVPLGEGFIPVVEATRRLVAAGVDRICYENCWAYAAKYLGSRSDGTMGAGAFAYSRPPYDPAICVPNMPYQPPPGAPTIEEFVREHGLDAVALEAEANRRSIQWLKTEYAKAGIELARELNAAA